MDPDDKCRQTSAMELQTVCTGVDFGEGPRWHDGRLWYCDFYQHRIYAVDEDGTRETMVEFPDDHPSGLGWSPSGDLLVVSMQRRQIRRIDRDGVDHLHARRVAGQLGLH